MTKERPIIFSSDMVKAIMDGRKTQTRRVIKLDLADQFDVERDGSLEIMTYEDADGHTANILGRCPYGKAGDQLWVRESFCIVDYSTSELCLRYENSSLDWWINPGRAQFEKYSHENFSGKTRPSIFMPRWASRIQLEVTGVRCQRLQEISEDDAKVEGAPHITPSAILHQFNKPYEQGHRAGFKTLWDSINAKRGYSWQSNPWVWVVEFEVTE